MSLKRRLLEKNFHLNDVDKLRLAKYFDCLIEMHFNLRSDTAS